MPRIRFPANACRYRRARPVSFAIGACSALCAVALVGLALASLALAAPRARLSWRDLESRIQYGYYTEDTGALRALQDTVTAGESRDRLQGYYRALLAWRLAQLAEQSPSKARGGTAAQLARRCVRELDQTIAAAEDFTEAVALRAACLVTEASAAHGSFAAYRSFAARRARREIDRAQRLDAHNPRVLLIEAMSEYQLAPELGGDKERALAKLHEAVSAFETERAGLEPLPGWGGADAYLLLARDLLDHGEALAARDALERALLLAPDFVPARRLMAQIISG